MDNFYQRETFRKLKTSVELDVFKKQDVNKIYKYNDFLVEQIYPLDEKSATNLTNKINYIKDSYLNETNKIYYSIIPDKNYYTDNSHLKPDYDKMKQIMKNNLKDLQYIDIFQNLKLDSYYYTDSHWKQEKLQSVAKTIANNMNFTINQNYNEQKVATFKGVYAGQLPINTKEDEMKILVNDAITDANVYNYETKEQGGIYNFKKLSGYDKYDIYLSGATPLIEISNSNNKTNKTLVIFRDSYASSLAPLLMEGYSKITLVDTRYISPKILNEYVNFENADILFIYSTLVINSSMALKQKKQRFIYNKNKRIEYFSLGEIPENLAEEKTSKAQIKMCFVVANNENWQTLFD